MSETTKDAAAEFERLVELAKKAAKEACEATHALMQNLIADEPEDAMDFGEIWRAQSKAAEQLNDKLERSFGL